MARLVEATEGAGDRRDPIEPQNCSRLMFLRRTNSPYTFDFAADCRSISAGARHAARHFAQRTCSTGKSNR
jgi:hypothetical protein